MNRCNCKNLPGGMQCAWCELRARLTESERALAEQKQHTIREVIAHEQTRAELGIIASQKAALARRVLELEDIKPLLDAEKLVAAESALASARELLAKSRAGGGDYQGNWRPADWWLDQAMAALSATSAPSEPVAVTEAREELEICGSCREMMPGVDEYTGCPGRVCKPCHREWLDGQRENVQW